MYCDLTTLQELNKIYKLDDIYLKVYMHIKSYYNELGQIYCIHLYNNFVKFTKTRPILLTGCSFKKNKKVFLAYGIYIIKNVKLMQKCWRTYKKYKDLLSVDELLERHQTLLEKKFANNDIILRKIEDRMKLYNY
jgi:hypothetical protein